MTGAAAYPNVETFVFSPDNLARAEKIVAHYPEGRQASAVLPLLDLAQRQSGGWLPRAAMDYVAELLSMPRIRVYEVATFYSMFNLKPVGRYFVQVCRTTPCWLRGADELTETCRRKFGTEAGEVTEDGNFTFVEVECLGACVHAPMVQINDTYYEDLDPVAFERLLDAFARGETPKPGSQAGRVGAEPITGPTTLTAAAATSEGAK